MARRFNFGTGQWEDFNPDTEPNAAPVGAGQIQGGASIQAARGVAQANQPSGIFNSPAIPDQILSNPNPYTPGDSPHNRSFLGNILHGAGDVGKFVLSGPIALGNDIGDIIASHSAQKQSEQLRQESDQLMTQARQAAASGNHDQAKMLLRQAAVKAAGAGGAAQGAVDSSNISPWKVVGDVANTVLTVAPVGKGLTAAQAGYRAGDVGLGTVVRESSKLFGRVGAMGGAATALSDGETNPLKVAESAGAGYLGGRVLGAGVPLAGAAASKTGELFGLKAGKEAAVPVEPHVTGEGAAVIERPPNETPRSTGDTIPTVPAPEVKPPVTAADIPKATPASGAIAQQYGVKPQTVDFLHQNGVTPATQSILQRSQSEGIRNPDAFVVSEAKKLADIQAAANPGQPQQFEAPLIHKAGTPEPNAAATPGEMPPLQKQGDTATVQDQPALPRTGEQVLSDAAKRAADERARYQENPVVAAKNAALREGYDPYADLQRYDNAEAKAQGKVADIYHPNGLKPEQSLTYLKSLVDNPKNEIETILRQPTAEGKSVMNLIHEHGANTPAEQQLFSYANMRFDREFRQLHPGQSIDPTISDKELNAAIAAYEKANPNAQKDAAVFKGFGDNMLDYGVKHGVIDQAVADHVKATYKNYVPLERVIADDLPKISIAGGVRNSVAQQKFVQSLIGNNEKPLNNSFSTLVSRAEMAVKQGRTNQFDQEILRRAQAGTLGDAKVLVDPAVVAKRNELRAQLEELRNIRGQQIGDKSFLQGQARMTNAQLNEAKKQAMSKVKQLLKEETAGVQDPGIKAAIDGLTQDDMLAIFKGIQDGAHLGIRNNRIVTMADSTSGTLRIAKKLSAKGERMKLLTDEINNLKQDIQSNLDQSRNIRSQAASLEIDPTTHLAVIRGQQQGVPFAVEIPIDLAKGLSRLSPGQAKDIVANLAQVPANVQKTLFTGALAPIFTIVNSVVKNPMMMFYNAKGVTPWGARAIKGAVESVFKNSATQRALIEHGFNRTNATMSRADQKMLTEVMASRGGVGNYASFMVKHPVMAAGDAFHLLNKLGAVLDNAQRSQVGVGLYHNLRRQGVPEQEAWQRAAIASNEVMANFQRVTQAARAAEPVLLYTGATQSGLRSLVTATKTRPIESAIKGIAMIGAAVGVTSAALSSEQGKAYFDDMIKSGKQGVLDGNLIFVLPGATKDPKTGEWHGVLKIPIAPDFRPLHRSTWREVKRVSEGQGVDPVLAAKGLADLFTGDIRNNVIDPQAGFLGSNPTVQTWEILHNRDPKTHQPLTDESLYTDQSSQQYSTTTGAGKTLAKWLGISPIQADKLLGTGGYAGSLIQGRGNPVVALERQFSGGFGESAGKQWINNVNAQRDSLKVNPTSQDPQAIADAAKHTKELQAVFDAYLTKSVERGDPWYTQEFATLLLGHPEVRDAFTRLYKTQDSHPPFWDLTPEQQTQVLIYRHFDPHGYGLGAPADEAQKQMIKANPWYTDFLKTQNSYFDGLPKDVKDHIQTSEEGVSQMPQPSDDLKGKLDAYNAITDKTQKQDYLKANPGISDYFNQINAAKEAQRSRMGMVQDVTPDQVAALNEYQRLKDTGQKTGAFIAAHPELATYFSAERGIKGQRDLLTGKPDTQASGGSGVKFGTATRRSGRPAGGGFGGGGGILGKKMMNTRGVHTSFRPTFKKGSLKMGAGIKKPGISKGRLAARRGFSRIAVKQGKLV